MRLDVLSQYAVLPARRHTEFHVLARLSAEEARARRTPVHLVLVLDRSGSMREEKIASVKEAAKLLVDRLGREDLLAVVVYGSDVKTLLAPTPVEDRGRLKAVFDGIVTGGTTNLSGGWLMGLRHAAKAATRRSVTRVVLMTDGLANRGVTDVGKLQDIARTHRGKGLVTSTMGFGEGFSEEMLGAVAEAGGGNFHYIRYPDDVPAAFTDELGDALSVAAQNVTFAVEPKPGFAVSDVVSPFPFGPRGAGAEVAAGDLYAGEAKKLLVRVDANPTLPGRSWVVRVRAECDLVSGTHEPAAFEEVLETTFAEDPPDAEPTEEVVLEMGLLRSARVRKKAMALADAGDFSGAEKLLLACARELEAQRICSDRLGPEIREMRRFAEAFAQKRWSADARKTLSASVFLSRAGRLMDRRDKLVDTRVDEEP